MADLADADFDHPLDPPVGWARDHVHEYVQSGGEKGHRWKPGVDTLLLTTVGRKSAKTRRTPLIYGKTDGSYAVVASKGGSDVAPLWYTNLLADPRARIQAGPKVMDARGRVAEGAERTRLWDQMATIWPDYNKYQTKTDRQIPVVVLEPVTNG
jgi:deazaflavin-dependent oxidoreductase (nitroreductase family)